MISGNCPGKRKHQFAICCLFSGICLQGRNVSGQAWPLCCLHTEHGSSLAWMLPAFSLKFVLGRFSVGSVPPIWQLQLSHRFREIPRKSQRPSHGSGLYCDQTQNSMSRGRVAFVSQAVASFRALGC